MQRFDTLSEKLTDRNIKPSIQRLKILEYLLGCKAHPTVEQIYNELKTKVHSLSKATIYNTLTLFAEKGLVRVLTLENTENRYDILTHDHGHFVCETCGAITDIEVSMDRLQANQLDACQINQIDVFYRGICKRCLDKK